jgi:hypothetical protein
VKPTKSVRLHTGDRPAPSRPSHLVMTAAHATIPAASALLPDVPNAWNVTTPSGSAHAKAIASHARKRGTKRGGEMGETSDIGGRS